VLEFCNVLIAKSKKDEVVMVVWSEPALASC